MAKVKIFAIPFLTGGYRNAMLKMRLRRHCKKWFYEDGSKVQVQTLRIPIYKNYPEREALKRQNSCFNSLLFRPVYEPVYELTGQIVNVSTQSVMRWIHQFYNQYAEFPEQQAEAEEVEIDEMHH